MKKIKKFTLLVVSLVVFMSSTLLAIPTTHSFWSVLMHRDGYIFHELRADVIPIGLVVANSWSECRYYLQKHPFAIWADYDWQTGACRFFDVN